jgi:phasin family protein
MATTTKKNGTAKTAQETLEAVAEAQKKSFDDAVQAGTDAFAQGYEEFYNTTRAKMDEAQKTAFENFDQISDFNRENVEAMIVSSNIVAKGFEVIGKEVAAFAQQAAEANMAAAKKFSAAKNPQDMMDLQADWAKTAFDGFVAESSKLQDITVKVSNQAAQPINDRINKAVETFAKPIAA